MKCLKSRPFQAQGAMPALTPAFYNDPHHSFDPPKSVLYSFTRLVTE